MNAHACGVLESVPEHDRDAKYLLHPPPVKATDMVILFYFLAATWPWIHSLLGVGTPVSMKFALIELGFRWRDFCSNFNRISHGTQ